MTEPPPADYVFEQIAVDRERLRLASGLVDRLTSETCIRARVRKGAHVIDIGSGQLGTLVILAELVGPTGIVVGF